MSKILKLINDEKKALVVTATKGCVSDYTAENDPCSVLDEAICTTGVDECWKSDHAACSTGAVDICYEVDNSGCHEKHLDVCQTLDNSYCAEAEKYDYEG